MPSDLIRVYLATDIEEADVIVNWLGEYGITAVVEGALEIPVVCSPQDIEVCVSDPADAKRAIELLRDHYKPKDQAEEPEDDSRTIEAICEECGKTVSFPYAQRGTVQDCPHCGEYVDVPDKAEAC
ncbi:MAG: hypothetical protein KAV82_12495 [Phycisphaerae bacterium]|nr:hypothetical protein [Phycisphaerae bacterium]